MSYKGTTFTVDEYCGYEATISAGVNGEPYSLGIEEASDITSLSINYSEILEEDMTDLKGGKYWTEYLGSYLCYARQVDADHVAYVEAHPQTDINLTAAYAASYLDSIPMTLGQVYVDFGSFKFGNEFDSVIVRPDCALITGVIKVSQGTYDCNTPVTVQQGNKEYQLMKGSSSKYDYYTYDGYLIQVGMGLDITQYIQFK